MFSGSTEKAPTTVTANPVELLRALTRFDTSNPPGDVRACVEFVADLLRERDIEPLVVGLEPERPNLIARLPGPRLVAAAPALRPPGRRPGESG